jgi:hypothetical protein
MRTDRQEVIMRLGLECSCGHEFDFDMETIELFLFLIFEPMVVKCNACRKEILIKRSDDKLAAHRITSIQKTGFFIHRHEHDNNPISTCPIPAGF